jgi:hypothetical protein
MRVMAAAILCVFAIVLTTMSSYSEPEARGRIYFAAPLGTNVLLGSFKLGLNVTMLSGKGICKAKTGSAFSIEHLGGQVKATNVTGSGKCREDVTIAVVGSAAESVQLHLPQEIQTPLPADVELKVRQYVEPLYHPKADYSLAGPDPQAFKVGRFTLLKFRWKGVDELGPCVLCFDDQFFEFPENCTRGHVFFSVNEALYLAFHEGGCFSGVDAYCVYDLSGASPKRVYSDGLSC